MPVMHPSSSIQRLLQQENIKNNPLARLTEGRRSRLRALLIPLLLGSPLVLTAGVWRLFQTEENTLRACQQMAEGENLMETEYVPVFLGEPGPRFNLAGPSYQSFFPQPFHELKPEDAQRAARHCNAYYYPALQAQRQEKVTAEQVRMAIEDLALE